MKKPFKIQKITHKTKRELADKEIALICPNCGRKLKGIGQMITATQIIKRTCKCCQIWRITVTVLGSGEGFLINKLDWVPAGFRPDPLD